jgi:hypothetical protein
MTMWTVVMASLTSFDLATSLCRTLRTVSAYIIRYMENV